MEVSFVSLLSCNQLGLWDEQWGGGHATPIHPPLVIRSCKLSEMNNEEEDTPPLPHPPLVIRSWELSEMSNAEQDTPPTIGHQEFRVTWDELVHIMNKKNYTAVPPYWDPWGSASFSTVLFSTTLSATTCYPLLLKEKLCGVSCTYHLWLVLYIVLTFFYGSLIQ